MGLVHHLASRNAYVGCRRGGETHCAQFFVCERCGAVSEFEDDGLATLIQTAADRSGFAAQGSVVEIRGCCTRCLGAAR
jgi:Fur family zinc uptake transcriptional regulator